MYSVDCFFQDDFDYKEVYYIKVVFVMLLPLALIFLIGLTFQIWYWVTKNEKIIDRYMIASIVISFFLIHPSMTEFIFNIFSCRYIDGDGFRLTVNLDIECFDD